MKNVIESKKPGVTQGWDRIWRFICIGCFSRHTWESSECREEIIPSLFFFFLPSFLISLEEMSSEAETGSRGRWPGRYFQTWRRLSRPVSHFHQEGRDRMREETEEGETRAPVTQGWHKPTLIFFHIKKITSCKKKS